MSDEVANVLGTLLSVLAFVAAIATTLHAALTREDPRTALGWIGLAWLSPLIGAFLYAIFGVNRIRRRARAQQRSLARAQLPRSVPGEEIVERLDSPVQLRSLARAMDEISERPLVTGCDATLLVDGDQAYPAMLAAIDEAKSFVGLTSYIFEARGPGAKIIEALVRAKERNVEVRVLVDAAGERYSRPRVTRLLRRRGIKASRFMPAWVPWHWPYLNLRNHRKLLVVDGEVGFTGGLNIRPDHVLGDEPRHPTRDLHVRLVGPVVGQLLEAFCEDWGLAGHEKLEWKAEPKPSGDMACRVVLDGPDEDHDRARDAILAAIASAEQRICVVTPYFLPDDAIARALQTAAQRGVRVDVVLPLQSNLRIVGWAMEHALLVAPLSSVRTHRSGPPFDHSKILVVDESWSFLGSANWDPRSLRLNFELNVECYSQTLGARLTKLIDDKIAHCSPHRAEQSSWRRARNALMALFQPYL